MTIREIFKSHKGNLIYKWDHYFEIYQNHFEKFKSKKNITILEIGVLGGGSLQMWKKFFGKKSKIYGIDKNPICKNYEEENITIKIGSSSDEIFLNNLVDEIDEIDIIIDDGSHRMEHQITAFKHLFKKLPIGGLYLIEDTHTSYWNSFGGGLRRSGTFIEFSKKLVDSIHAHFSDQFNFNKDKYTDSIDSISFYDSIVCIYKGERKQKPFPLFSGKHNHQTKPDKKSLIFNISFNILLFLNKILQYLKIKGFILRGEFKIK